MPLRHRAVRGSLLVALIAGLAWGVLRTLAWTPEGFTRTVYADIGFNGERREELARSPGLEFMARPHMPRRFFSARWQGVWVLSRSGDVDLHLGADDWARLLVDGEPVLERGLALGYRTLRATRTLSAGAHRIEIEYEQHAGGAFLAVGWSPPGEPIHDFGTAIVVPTAPPEHFREWNGLVRAVGLAALVALAFGATLLTLGAISALRERALGHPDGWRGVARACAAPVARQGRWIGPAAAALIVLYGAALRFEALSAAYGPFERPGWLLELEAHTRSRIEALRPSSFGWRKIDQPYVGGDPINYLKFAREERAFYGAHVREPIFPAATRTWLALTGGQDAAVSFASATFSVLAIAALYVLGSAAFSRPVGLAAALGLAVEKDMVQWGADGWRDDALTFFVVLSAWTLVRLWRRPTVAAGVLAGAVGAGAVLTRVTTLSFLVPALGLVLIAGAGSLRARAWSAAAALAATLLLSGPYLVNCWIEYGDPFYAINYHTGFYRARSGEPYQEPMSTAAFLGGRLQRDPVGTMRLALEGVTSYPFSVKWTGFDFWARGLGRGLAVLAGIGLALFTTTRTGTFLLFILVASLVPYAFTWQIPGGAEWRFTMHAYPFYLLAAALAGASAFRLPAVLRGARVNSGPPGALSRSPVHTVS